MGGRKRLQASPSKTGKASPRVWKHWGGQGRPKHDLNCEFRATSKNRGLGLWEALGGNKRQQAGLGRQEKAAGTPQQDGEGLT